jgi:hypothetical protein
VEKSIYLSALALSPTLEKELIDRQKAILLHFGLPSALALPPVYPLGFASSPPAAGREADRRGLFRGTLIFSGYRFRGRCIFAAAGGVTDRAAVIGGETEASLFPVFPGFYLADMGEEKAENIDLSRLPVLPVQPVRVVRSLVLHILLKGTDRQWWRAVEWEVIRERYIKLDSLKG